MVADVALEIGLGAGAGVALDHGLVVLTVEAFGVLLSAHVGNRLAKETLVFTVPTVVGCPELIVRGFAARVVGTLALSSVKLAEIEVGKESAFALSSGQNGLSVILIDLLVVSIRPIHHKLLRDTVRLNNNVLDHQLFVCDLEFFPSCTLVPADFNLVNRHLLLCNRNNATVIPDFIDPAARFGPFPVEATVTGEEE